jgi:hypothetical protein
MATPLSVMVTTMAPFSYDEPFITLGPFEGDDETIYEFVIIDNSDPTCSGYVEIGPVDCPGPCIFPDTEVQTTISCFAGEDVYELTIDFDASDADGIGFDVFWADGSTQFFNYEDLPVTIQRPIPAAGEEAFSICENDRPDCCKDVVVSVPCCSIFDFTVEASDCQTDGTFNVVLGMEHIGTNGTFTLVYGRVGSPLSSATYEYGDLPVVIEGLDGTTLSDWFFQVTDASFFCQASVTLEDVFCDSESCVEFEDLDGSFFGPNTGFFDGDVIGEEDGVVMTYEDNGGNCTGCYIFILDNTTYPQFTAGSGKIAAVSQSGFGFDFAGLSEDVTSVTLDYYHPVGTTFTLAVNGEAPITVDNPTELPADVATGVTVTVDTDPNDPSLGTMTFTGNIDNLEFYSFLLLLDNLCIETAPEMDICMVLGDYDVITEPVDLAVGDGDDGNIIHEENGVIVRAASVSWVNEPPFLGAILVTKNPGCTDFALADGPYFQLDVAAIELDFTEFESLPNTVRFDYSYCPGTDFINLKVNDNEIFRGFFADAPTTLADGTEITISQQPTSPESGTITITGAIEQLVVGGVPMSIDNICYNGIPPQEDVWPGDANSDNIAHHVDLISIGLAYNSDGPARPEVGDEWSSFAADDWDQEFADGTNYKHADCNGDGVVNSEDREAIEQNYNLTHGPEQPFIALPGTDIDPPIFVDFPDQIPGNTTFEVPIILGTEDLPMEDIYGVAFTVQFDPELFDPADLEVIYPASWFGEEDINMITIDRIYDEGMIEISVVRIDQNEVSGFGPIAYIRGIIDDIAGIAPAEVMITDVTAMNQQEIRIPVQNPAEKIVVGIEKIEEEPDLSNLIYPNPTSGPVNINVAPGTIIQTIEIYDTHSNLVLPMMKNVDRFDVGALPAGVYIVRVKIEGIVHRVKLVKVD